MAKTTMAKIKRLDEEFENFLDKAVVDDSSTGLTPSETKQRRELADNDDLQFARIYFPGIFNEPDNEIVKWLATLESGRYTASGHRRCGKSAFCYIGKTIKSLALGVGGILNTSLRVEDDAKERNASLVRLMKRNKKLMYDYNIQIQQDNKNHYIINNTHLVPSSYQQGLRSILDDDFNRIRLSINDDLYNKNSVTSTRDNDKVTDFITSEVYGQMDKGALSITLGNSINSDCPIVRLKTISPENHFSFPALNEAGLTNWAGHSEFTTEYWNEYKTSIPFDTWMGEYMDDPLVKGEMFDLAWLQSVNLNLIKIIASLTAIDPAKGQSPSACYKGVATMGITNSNETIMLDMYLRKEGWYYVFDHVHHMRTKFPNWKTVLFEDDFDQWAIAKPYYDQWCLERKMNLPIWRYSAKGLKTEFYSSDKESRILNLVFPHQTGKFKYNSEIFEGAGETGICRTEDMKLYRNQYLSFGKSKEKLDGLDAAATGFIMLPRWVERGNFKSLKQRSFLANKKIFRRG